jgi:uncharacterized protein (DUF1697 family)
LSAAADPKLESRLAELAVAPERVVALGRELYTWHPDGIGRSRLAAQLARPLRGINATARNWFTVTALLALADE